MSFLRSILKKQFRKAGNWLVSVIVCDFPGPLCHLKFVFDITVYDYRNVHTRLNNERDILAGKLFKMEPLMLISYLHYA